MSMQLRVRSAAEIASSTNPIDFSGDGRPCIFDEMSPMHGLCEYEFHALSAKEKALLLRMIARCCEKSFRRGFQQGWDSKERGDKVCDLHDWRFGVSLGLSPSPHGTYHSTSLERLRIECQLYLVGLPRMENSFLTKRDIEIIERLFTARKQRSRASLKKSLRFAVLRRDSFRCVYCGADASNGKLHVDHVKPVSLGGTDDELNLVTACESCNLGKSNRHGDIALEGHDGR